MTAGELRHWITLDNPFETVTPVVFVPSRVAAKIEPSAPGSFDEDKRSLTVWIRYHAQVTEHTRITHRGREFTVRGVRNVDERNEWLELLCEEVPNP